MSAVSNAMDLELREECLQNIQAENIEKKIRMNFVKMMNGPSQQDNM